MAGEWIDTTLGGVTDFLSGGTPSKDRAEYWGGSIPWVSAKDMKRFRLDDTEDHVTTEGVANGTRLVPPGTVLLLARGMTLLNDVPICVTDRPMTFNQDVKALRPKPQIRDDFLPYLLLGNKIRLLSLVDLAGHGTGRLNSDELKALDIVLPPSSEQRAIAQILGTLDEKIELNRRMNETLEAMARTIFKSWFVDFDPVRAKAEGRQPEGMDAETAALFPDGFEDSALGKVPRRWRVGTIYEIADVIYGAPYSSKLFNSTGEGLPLIRIRDLATHEPEVFTSEEHPKGTVIRSGDVVCGMDGEFRIHHWRGEPALMNQRVCFFQPKSGISRVFVSETISEPIAFFERSKTGTTVIHLGKADIDTFRVVVPSNEVHLAFANSAEPLLDRRLAAAQESRTLAAIRDALLPKLLSGEIRVGEVEAAVGKVV